MPRYEIFLDVEVPEHQALSDYTPRTIASEIAFTDTIINVQLPMNKERFTKLISSIANGAFWTYPDEWLEIMAWFWQAMSEAEIVSCEDIADCIETSEDVQQAIITNEEIIMANLRAEANSGLNYPSIDDATDTIFTVPEAIGSAKDDEIKPLANCDRDALWAGIRDGIVARLDDNGRSVLEWLVTKADIAERAKAAIGAIPVFGDLANALLTQIVEAAPDMLNLYELYSSTEHMDEIACELFGLVCAECRYPTYGEIYQYYAAFGVTGMTDIDDLVIAAASEYLLAGTELTALAFYHQMIAFQLFVLYMGSKFYGLSGNAAIITLASLGEDFANDNWLVLCDTCNEPYSMTVYDFTQSPNGGFKTAGFSSSAGTYLEGKGWAIDKTSATGGRLTVEIPISSDWQIDAVAFQTTLPAASYNRALQLRPIPNTATSATGINLDNGSGIYQHCKDGLVHLGGNSGIAISLIDTAWTPSYLTKLAVIWHNPNRPDSAIMTNDPTLCDAT